ETATRPWKYQGADRSRDNDRSNQCDAREEQDLLLQARIAQPRDGEPEDRTRRRLRQPVQQIAVRTRRIRRPRCKRILRLRVAALLRITSWLLRLTVGVGHGLRRLAVRGTRLRLAIRIRSLRLPIRICRLGVRLTVGA